MRSTAPAGRARWRREDLGEVRSTVDVRDNPQCQLHSCLPVVVIVDCRKLNGHMSVELPIEQDDLLIAQPQVACSKVFGEMGAGARSWN